MTTRLLRLAAVVFLLTGSVTYAAIPPAENLLPADTLAFFSIPDCAAARVAARSSPAWMLWDDQAMRPFRDKLLAKWHDQFIAPLEDDLGIKMQDFTDLPQGQLTVAMTINGSNGHDDVPPGLLLLLDARDKSNSLKTNLASLTKKWADAGRAVRTEKIHGLAFTVVPLNSNDFEGILPKKPQVQELGKEPPKPGKPGEIYLAQFDSLLVVGNSVKVLEPVVSHLTGGSAPAIADNPVFAADKLSQFRDNPKYYGWFNGKGLFDMLAQTPPNSEDDNMPPSAFSALSSSKALDAFGLSSVKSASLALHETRAGTMLTIHLNAPESQRAGLLKILALPPKDASAPPFVPADAIKFSRVRLDGKQTWAELQKMIDNISPGGEASLNAVINIANSLGKQKDPGFDLRNDLIGNLNDDIITYQKPATGDSVDGLPSTPTLFLLAVSNPDAAINAIKTLSSMSNPRAGDSTPREFQGRKIHSIALKPAPAVPGGVPQSRTLYVSYSGGYVALSMDSSMVEEFLRNADGRNKPLRENPGLLDAMQRLGGSGGGLFGYENQRETVRLAFKALKTTAGADATLMQFPPAFRPWLDFSLLPDFDAVSKYFYVSAYAGSANAEGLTLKYFTPRPPQLN
jgi:hypothetical protein